MLKIGFEGYESYAVGQYFVGDDAGVVVVEEVLYRHGGYLTYHGSA
jgi:hypothetical protein